MEIASVGSPAVQFDTPQVSFLIEVDEFVHSSQARQHFKVSGKGLCAAVLDTGLTRQHVDFASQRLHQTVNPKTRTEIFAPGAPVTSSGINGPHGESIQQGTSQATSVTVGIILHLQEFYQRHAGQLPTVDQPTNWLRRGGVPIRDGDDEDDNVQFTNLTFLRIDAVRALNACYRELVRLKLDPTSLA
jgi:hypothetical protein